MWGGGLGLAVLFLLASVAAVALAKRLRSSAVIGYLAAGVLIGPHALGLVPETGLVEELSEFGVVFLMFVIGLELPLKRLRALRRQILGLGATQIMLTGTALAWLLAAVGYKPAAVMIVASGLALSSTAFVVQLLAERDELSARHGRISFAILLAQDLAAVPLLALVPLMGHAGAPQGTDLMVTLAKSALVVGVVVVAGRLLLGRLLRFLFAVESAELTTASTLLLVLTCAAATHWAGLSMALGAFLVGVLMADTEFRHQLWNDIEPFRGLLMGLFFMSVGMAVDVGAVAMRAHWLLAALVALLLAKTALIWVACRLFGATSATALRVGTLLAQGGEFGFVLFALGQQTGSLSGPQAEFLAALVTLSMIATPWVAALGDRLAQRIEAAAKLDAKDGGLHVERDETGHVVIAGFGRVGQNIARVLAACGQSYVALDASAARVAACRRQGYQVYFGDATRPEVLRAAGAKRAIAVLVTLDKEEAGSRAAAALRHHFKGIPVIVRARDTRHARALRDEGVAAALPETAESSLQLAAVLLRRIGTDHQAVAETIERFRQDSYEALEGVVIAAAAPAPATGNGQPAADAAKH